MAILKYKKDSNVLLLYECERDKATHSDHWHHTRACAICLHNDDYNTIDDILSLLSITDLSTCEKDSYNEYTLSKDINPYCMKINWKFFMYFGEDIPVVKSKTVKSKTKHYMFWNKCYGFKDKKPETYYYVEVKEPDKLFALGSTIYDFANSERILEWNEKPNDGIHSEAYFDYIAKFDYSDEVYENIISEKIKKELEAKKQREKYLQEIEQRKNTPGYCSCCGSDHAHLTVNPFNVEYYRDFTPVWLCSMCYESYLGDI